MGLLAAQQISFIWCRITEMIHQRQISLPTQTIILVQVNQWLDFLSMPSARLGSYNSIFKVLSVTWHKIDTGFTTPEVDALQTVLYRPV